MFSVFITAATKMNQIHYTLLQEDMFNLIFGDVILYQENLDSDVSSEKNTSINDIFSGFSGSSGTHEQCGACQWWLWNQKPTPVQFPPQSSILRTRIR